MHRCRAARPFEASISSHHRSTAGSTRPRKTPVTSVACLAALRPLDGRDRAECDQQRRAKRPLYQLRGLISYISRPSTRSAAPTAKGATIRSLRRPTIRAAPTPSARPRAGTMPCTLNSARSTTFDGWSPLARPTEWRSRLISRSNAHRAIHGSPSIQNG